MSNTMDNKEETIDYYNKSLFVCLDVLIRVLYTSTYCSPFVDNYDDDDGSGSSNELISAYDAQTRLYIMHSMPHLATTNVSIHQPIYYISNQLTIYLSIHQPPNPSTYLSIFL